jgi:uncharacterized integral membrane protein
LLCTPLTVPEILRGQQLALARQFFWPIALVLAVELIFMRAAVLNSMGPTRTFWYFFYIGMMLMLAADLVAMYWIGAWQGVAARSHSLALNATIARVMVWPWLVTIVVLAIVLTTQMQSGMPRPEWALPLGLWFLSGIVADAVFALAARDKLLTEFRAAAQHRFSGRAPWWQRALGVKSEPE